MLEGLDHTRYTEKMKELEMFSLGNPNGWPKQKLKVVEPSSSQEVQTERTRGNR